MFHFTNQRKIFLLLPVILLFSAGAAFAQGTAFTFQGKLGDSGSPVNGTFDMQFKLFDAADPNSSNQIGTTITLNNPLVQVTNGVFTVQLDFGAAALPGADRFLEIGIRHTSSDPYSLLSPRTKVTSAPYAIRSLNASGADGLSTACVGCIQSTQINSLDASKLTGTLPASTISASSVPAGSTNYIQNQTAVIQPSANFAIDGTGSANIVNANNHYNLGGHRVLSNPGTGNLFAGVNAGNVNTSGFDNAFFGSFAGVSNTSGSGNAFFGAEAGNSNSGGFENAFFGENAGGAMTNGQRNSFFGSNAGALATGSNNTFIGNLTGFPGGNGPTSGDFNTSVGSLALVSPGISHATAIGAQAFATTSNTVVLGRNLDTVFVPGNLTLTGTFSGSVAAPSITGTLGTPNGGTGLNAAGAAGNFLRSNGTSWTSSTIQPNDIPTGSANYIQNTTSQQASSNFNISGNGLIAGKVGIGTTAPAKHLHVKGPGDQEIAIESSDASGRQWTLQSSRGSVNGRFEIVDRTAGASRLSILDSGNVGIGTTTPTDVLQVVGAGTAIKVTDSAVSTRFFSSNSTGKGYVGTSSASPLVLRTGDTDRVTIDKIGFVGIGTTSPKAALEVTNGYVYVNSPVHGIILKSPNGSCFLVVVNDLGFLTSTPFTCPQ